MTFISLKFIDYTVFDRERFFLCCTNADTKNLK